jgi:SAM-dependent methyltransferase
MPFRVTFPRGRPDLLGRLSRLRWRAEFEEPCAGISGTLVVDDERALPIPGSGAALAAASRALGQVQIFAMDSAASEEETSWTPPPVQTASEAERIDPPENAGERELARPPAASPARFVPEGSCRGSAVVAGFRVIRVPETFGIREEVLDRIPPGARRLLDVGCGGAETAAEARRRFPGLRAEGIDVEGADAESSRSRLDAFHSGDAITVLRSLARRSARFDVVLLADVLEHCEDPFLVLEEVRSVCAPGATLVVSIPNAAAAPIVGDLIVGRFDPVGAGPEDAGHLRWLTRRSLRELLEESGFPVLSLEAIPVPRDTRLAERLRQAGLRYDPEELSAIQWIATARHADRS